MSEQDEKRAAILKVADDMLSNPSYDIMPSVRTTMKDMADLLRFSAPDARLREAVKSILDMEKSASETKAVCEWVFDSGADNTKTSCDDIYFGSKPDDFECCPFCGLPISVKEK